MRVRDILRPRAALPGTRWDGPYAWSTDFPRVVPCPGFYALAPDGKTLRRPLVRLVAIDDAPDDPDDGSWHLEVAAVDDPAQKHATGGEVVAARQVELDAHVIGEGDTEGAVR